MGAVQCREWVKALSSTAYKADVLLVAGDITDKLDILEVRAPK